MINFLRISNNIKFGDYLHSNGNINDIPSPDIIGVCIISSNFLPDRLARFMSLRQSISVWDRNININDKYKKELPGRGWKKLDWGFLDRKRSSLISLYLSNGSFNPDCLIDLPQGNAFQDYRGYENTEKYKKKYGDSDELNNVFSRCLRISPSYRKSDWYLPSVGELALLFEKKSLINSAIETGSKGVILSNNYHWSSSEYGSERAWYVDMSDGLVFDNNKSSNGYIRPFLTL